MNNLELFMKAVNAIEGLDVSLKIGKESELIIKGDFMKMANAFGTIMQAQSDSEDTNREVDRLEKRIKEIKDKA